MRMCDVIVLCVCVCCVRVCVFLCVFLHVCVCMCVRLSLWAYLCSRCGRIPSDTNPHKHSLSRSRSVLAAGNSDHVTPSRGIWRDFFRLLCWFFVPSFSIFVSLITSFSLPFASLLLHIFYMISSCFVILSSPHVFPFIAAALLPPSPPRYVLRSRL